MHDFVSGKRLTHHTFGSTQTFFQPALKISIEGIEDIDDENTYGEIVPEEDLPLNDSITNAKTGIPKLENISLVNQHSGITKKPRETLQDRNINARQSQKKPRLSKLQTELRAMYLQQKNTNRYLVRVQTLLHLVINRVQVNVAMLVRRALRCKSSLASLVIVG